MKKIFFNRKNNAGFTLIELIFYTLITAMVFGFAFSTVYQIIQSSDSLNRQNELVNNSEFIIKKLEWVLGGITGVVAPVTGTTGGTLSVNKIDATIGNLKVYATGTALFLQQGSGQALPITNSWVRVGTTSFTNFIFSTSTQNTIEFKTTLQDPANSSSTNFIDIFIPTR